MQASTLKGVTLATLLVIATGLTGADRVRADETPAPGTEASADSVRELIELTSGVALAEQMFSQLMSVLRQQQNMSQKMVDELRAETDFAELLEKTIPIYQKHLTQADVDAALVFWSSPAGQRFSSASPQISRESFEVGQVWGKELADRAIARIKARRPQ